MQGLSLELACAYSINADVLGAFGDPDSAAASAHHAIRLYQATAGALQDKNHLANFHRALGVLDCIAKEQGIDPLPGELGTLRATYGTDDDRPTAPPGRVRLWAYNMPCSR